MGHQLTGLCLIKIGCGKGLNMGKEAVSYSLLNPSRGSYETAPPNKPKYPDQQGDTHNIQGILEEFCGCDATDCKVIDSPFDDARDKELKDVNHKQGKKAKKDNSSFFYKVGFKNAV
jgi:hypothetical protein